MNETRAPTMSDRSSSHLSRPSPYSWTWKRRRACKFLDARSTEGKRVYLIVAVSLSLVSRHEVVFATESSNRDDTARSISESRKERRTSCGGFLSGCESVPANRRTRQHPNLELLTDAVTDLT
jgi:hypothetical protein